MKKSKLVAVLLAVALCFAALALPALAVDDIPDEVEAARQGVVRVLQRNCGTGTGFIIAQTGKATYIITNRHVVTDEEGRTYANAEIILTTSQERMLKANVYAIQVFDSGNIDLVMLEVLDGLKDRPVLPLCDSSNVKSGEAVYTLGFPGTGDNNARNAPSRPEDLTLTGGNISKLDYVYKRSYYGETLSYQHNASINYGNSGGPLLNKHGQVIGVNTWINPDDTSRSINFSIQIDYVISYCKKNDIAFVSGQPPEPTTVPPETVPPTTTIEPVTEAPPSPSFELKWYYIAGAVAVLALIAMLIVLLSRKKKEAVPAPAPQPSMPVAPAPPMPPAAAPQNYPAGPAQSYPEAPAQNYPPASAIVGTGGQFVGDNIPVPDRITLGRDPKRCNVVFQTKAAGVSALHCEIINVGGTMQLTDRGSSYGTFLASGVKLDANRPYDLHPGDSFYLGAKENSFRVV